jgi:hypothetical protein
LPKPEEGIVPRNVTLTRASHEPKAPIPMLLTPAGMVTLVRFLQFSKAESPILVTLFGMVTLVIF